MPWTRWSQLKIITEWRLDSISHPLLRSIALFCMVSLNVHLITLPKLHNCFKFYVCEFHKFPFTRVKIVTCHPSHTTVFVPSTPGRTKRNCIGMYQFYTTLEIFLLIEISFFKSSTNSFSKPINFNICWDIFSHYFHSWVHLFNP